MWCNIFAVCVYVSIGFWGCIRLCAWTLLGAFFWHVLAGTASEFSWRPTRTALSSSPTRLMVNLYVRSSGVDEPEGWARFASPRNGGASSEGALLLSVDLSPGIIACALLLAVHITSISLLNFNFVGTFGVKYIYWWFLAAVLNRRPTINEAIRTSQVDALESPATEPQQRVSACATQPALDHKLSISPAHPLRER